MPFYEVTEQIQIVQPEQIVSTAAHKDLEVVNALPVTLHHMSVNDSSDLQQ